jgi:hypothetical protein
MVSKHCKETKFLRPNELAKASLLNRPFPYNILIPNSAPHRQIKLKQSRYKPGVAKRVPGS